MFTHTMFDSVPIVYKSSRFSERLIHRFLSSITLTNTFPVNISSRVLLPTQSRTMSNSDSESSERTINPLREEHIISPFLRYWYILAIGEEEFLKQRKSPPSQETYTPEDVEEALANFKAVLRKTSWLSDFEDAENVSRGPVTLDTATVAYPDVLLMIIAEDLKLSWGDLKRDIFDHANFSEEKMAQLKDKYKRVVSNGEQLRKQMREDQFMEFMGRGRAGDV